MAVSGGFLSEDQFTCSICLDMFTNPVSTPCGHSFCLDCISTYWDGGAKVCQCPLCKESFKKKPDLHINRTLKEITDQFKHMAGATGEGGFVIGGLGAGENGAGAGNGMSTPDGRPQPPPRPGDLPGDLFAEMKTRFQRRSSSGTPPSQPRPPKPHTPPPPYSPPPADASFPRRYTLSGPSDASPDVPLCPTHLRPSDLFCRTDQTCVCGGCMEAEHQGHLAVPAKREWLIKKSQLGITEVELTDMITERERKVEEIRTSLEEIQACAEGETSGSISVFSALVSCLERSQVEVLEVIQTARRAAQNQAQALIRDLELEIAELRKRSATLTQLTQSDDYILFLKKFPALSSPPAVRDWSDVCVTSELSSGAVLQTVTQMMERFQEELKRLAEMSLRSPSDQSLARNNPKVRSVQDYAVDVTLDPSTAHPRLLISNDGRQVSCGDRYLPVLDIPERFDRVVCVLGRQGFSSGRHYWEVEVGGKTDWDLGVASRSINRKGKIVVSPAHGYWFLSLRGKSDYAARTEPSTALGLNHRPRRIGLYLDWDKGQVSFYNVDAKTLIYTFLDSFSDTLHPFFSPCTNKSGKNEAPLIICPVSMDD